MTLINSVIRLTTLAYMSCGVLRLEKNIFYCVSPSVTSIPDMHRKLGVKKLRLVFFRSYH